MSKTYSAHPAKAWEQLQCAELAKDQHNNTIRQNYNAATTIQHRRHNNNNNSSINLTNCENIVCCKQNVTTPTALHDVLDVTLQQHNKTLPDRTILHRGEEDVSTIACDYAVIDEDDLSDSVTKDCVNCENDEPDALQQAYCRTNTLNALDRRTQSIMYPTHNRHYHLSSQHLARDMDISGCASCAAAVVADGSASGMSSTISSPSASTVSTPLSTPTRLTPHHQVQPTVTAAANALAAAAAAANCVNTGTAGSATVKTITSNETANNMPKQQQQRHHYLNRHHPASSATSGCKKQQKFDPRAGPSPYRQLLPIALCILSFACVFTVLIFHMDMTEIRHQQFRLNMSRDYDMYGVTQDDPQLIEFLREIHMRKYPMHFLKSRGAATSTAVTPTVTTSSSSALLNSGFAQRFNFNAPHDQDDLAPIMARYVATLVGGKVFGGAVIQSLPGSLGHLLTAPWLAETLDWVGVIVEPEPRRYFSLRKENAQQSSMQVIHACVSPSPYPKEVSIHNEDSEVRINSLLDEETSWFNSRVKCFPLYTIMLAYNRTQYDLLSLGVHGHELEILQTLPFEKVQIEVISIHLPEDHEDARSGSSKQYIITITQFLAEKSYRMQRQFGRNYFYQRQNSKSRTRKKDILLLKTP